MPAVSNLPIFPQTANNWTTQLIAANTTNVVSLVAGAGNGSLIQTLMATSNNTTDLALDLWVNDATDNASNTLLCSIIVPANSGNNSNPAIPSVNILGSAQLPGLPKDAAGNPYLVIAVGTTLGVSSNASVAAGKQMAVFATGGNY